MLGFHELAPTPSKYSVNLAFLFITPQKSVTPRGVPLHVLSMFQKPQTHSQKAVLLDPWSPSVASPLVSLLPVSFSLISSQTPHKDVLVTFPLASLLPLSEIMSWTSRSHMATSVPSLSFLCVCRPHTQTVSPWTNACTLLMTFLMY